MPEAPTRLAQILYERGWSQGRLVRESGVNRMTVWWAYHNTQGVKVSTDSLLMIAKALDVPLSEIAPDLADRLRGVAI